MKPRRDKTHPAYGNAVLHRTHGHIGRLHGSPLSEHTTSMRLTISRASFANDLGQDWHHATDQLIEIEFSPAQFADFITTANVGGGVPCTIRYIRPVVGIEGEDVGQIPPLPDDEQLEADRVIDYFKKGRKETADALKAGLANLKTVLAKKTLSKDDKREIEWLIGKALQDVESNEPFVLKQFTEATEKLVSSAKAEMAASVQATVEQLGFRKLEELRAALAAGAVKDGGALAGGEATKVIEAGEAK